MEDEWLAAAESILTVRDSAASFAEMATIDWLPSVIII